MTHFESEDKNSVFNRFVRDFGLYSIAKLVPAVASLIALMVFTRFFPPAAYGRYALAASFIGIFSTLCFDWVGKSVYRFAAEMRDDVVVGNAISMVSLTAFSLVVLGTAGYVLWGAEMGDFRPFYFAVLIVIVVQGFFQTFKWFFQTTLQSKSVMGYRIFESLLKLALSLLLAILVLNHIVGWIWGAVAATGVTVLLMAYKLGRSNLRPRLDPKVVRRFTRYGVPMLGWMIGVPLLSQADRVLLELLRGSAAVGIYSSNYQITDSGIRLVFSPIITAAYPIIMNTLEESNEQEVAGLITRFSRYFVLIAVPAFIGAAFLSRTLSSVLLDDAYLEGYIVIPFVAGGVLFLTLANIGQITMEVREQTKLISAAALTAVVVNLLLNIPLITLYGYLGAAVATTVSYSTYALLVYYFSKRHLEWTLPTSTIRNTIVGGALMATPPAVLYVSDSYTALRVTIALLVGFAGYVAVLYSLGEVDEEKIYSLIE
jgi:O-antigen/teichoic acid export membrane protein